MDKAQNPPITSRKQPQQARSAELVAAILQAAIQVLQSEGAQRFTTARVAERAGVSIGSLYQYFPNKAAILFRLQSDEWLQTGDLLRDILQNQQHPPLLRLRHLVHAFVRSECEEAQMRIALQDAAPLYRNAPQAKQAKAASQTILHDFMHEVLPDNTVDERQLAADLIGTSLGTVGKQFSEQPRSDEEISRYAGAMADMFCAYLIGLQARP